MPNLKGKLCKTAAGRDTYDIDNADPVLLFPICSEIEKKFGFNVPNLPFFGLDGTYIKLIRNDVEIVLGWDVWSDIFVMAVDDKGDKIVQEIGIYLNSIIEDLEKKQVELLKNKK